MHLSSNETRMDIVTDDTETVLLPVRLPSGSIAPAFGDMQLSPDQTHVQRERNRIYTIPDLTPSELMLYETFMEEYLEQI